ncbi:probable disease resistance protein At4g27220 [Rosa rugosa]|uniref:probable disease resistance protein At4g27220 n=1 Tax=Rosa rugosa TaxID=74645 RepID=UPI002B403967|nr:probable disease resistance protein At4g27220 [Rosa rugosa]XP_062002046.1 probable disease resistance protein At4g27220 [Rosa rugosa]XP_062002047.1 probable disease resistance protein At4g27220 [Rosa rugosa]XP_062002048.1 probable disease resistance protein At4g27220 [Rosa rugosa]XP_062002049.1 probable disease resistance protein At4g27220 [Rosa rugosa]XP_062002050.1 probable disease resistance protein At4g27220 [Rosa rugosa]XP_062002051.1 probable disease resistance protein At4g27220 [Ros
MTEDNQEPVDVDASASLPSSSAPRWKYDVFLSFRGSDTRQGITFELYDRLQNSRGIKTFMDDQDIHPGNDISPTLLMAIKESRFAIIVLSQNYASSTWCLEELRNICECMEEDKNRILPLFYRVDPDDVRYQKKSFAEAFTEHEKPEQHGSEKVQQWRDALKKVANFSGWHTLHYKTDRELVDAIEESVWNKLRATEDELKMSIGDFEAFAATKQAIDKVMIALKDDEATTIGVYGMGGVGKTTMVNYVGVQARENRLFDKVILAVVSQNPDLMKIQQTFAEMLDFELKKKTEIVRARELKKKIMRETKILIILDDIWKRIEFSDIGIPSHSELQRCNSKVLLTTRKLDVCCSMDCHANIHLNILSEEDSWSLFVEKARKSFDKSSNFYNIARKVASECAGLPIALISVARALRNENLDGWKEAARRLKASQPANPEDEGDVFKCIKLSYDYLKSDDSKSCFSLCCLFPEDYSIPIEYLLMYGIGKGMFQDLNMADARATTYLVVKALKDSCLLLDAGDDKCVRMHDVIRDMAIRISSSEDGQRFLVKARCELKNWPQIDANKGYSAISLMKNKIRKLPEELVCPNLQILLLQDNASLNEISESFFHSQNELRVLDVSSTCISLLPQSISFLANLQALYLDDCKHRIDISVIGKLRKLEILSMRRNALSKLPREIGQLTNLRMLNVSGSHIWTIPSTVISKLHKLEELYMQRVFSYWGRTIYGEGEGEETNVGFDELAGLSYLSILEVSISDANCMPRSVEVEPNWVYLKYFDIRICSDTDGHFELRRYLSGDSGRKCRSLGLHSTAIGTLPDWFVNAVVKKTERLSYEECKGLSNILVEYDRGRLHGLKVLSVNGRCKNLKELMNAITCVPDMPVFENLEELYLEDLDDLKQLCVGELPTGSLCSLKLLEVHCCCNLGNVLLPSKLLQKLPNLEKLICQTSGVEYVFGCEGFEPPDQANLREMKLFDLDAVRSICNGPAPRGMFQALKELAIERCNIQGSLFTFDVAQCLLQLETLDVRGCLVLERVIEARRETLNNKKTVLPKLKNLWLQFLPMLYEGSATVDFECPSLENLLLRDCPHLSFQSSASDYFHSRNQVNEDLSLSDIFK